MRRVGNEVVLTAVAPATADRLIDALMAFEGEPPIRRDQPTGQQQRAPIDPGAASTD